MTQDRWFELMAEALNGRAASEEMGLEEFQTSATEAARQGKAPDRFVADWFEAKRKGEVAKDRSAGERPIAQPASPKPATDANRRKAEEALVLAAERWSLFTTNNVNTAYDGLMDTAHAVGMPGVFNMLAAALALKPSLALRGRRQFDETAEQEQHDEPTGEDTTPIDKPAGGDTGDEPRPM